MRQWSVPGVRSCQNAEAFIIHSQPSDAEDEKRGILTVLSERPAEADEAFTAIISCARASVAESTEKDAGSPLWSQGRCLQANKPENQPICRPTRISLSGGQQELARYLRRDGPKDLEVNKSLQRHPDVGSPLQEKKS
jgi:hypothetical protein